MGVAGLGWLPLRVMSLAVLRGLRTGRGGGASIIVYYCILLYRNGQVPSLIAPGFGADSRLQRPRGSVSEDLRDLRGRLDDATVGAAKYYRGTCIPSTVLLIWQGSADE
jgi:hypothetical protein